MTRNISRRNFLVGCSTAIAAMAGARINTTVFGSPEQEPNQEIIIVVFLRGGIDALNLIPPIAGPDRGHYELARPQLMVPTAGANAAIPLAGEFGLHPSAATLNEIFQDQKLAIIPATGMPNSSRSHFDAMYNMETGVGGAGGGSSSGWLSRHLATSGLPTDLILPSLAVGNLAPTALQGNVATVAFQSINGFNLNVGNWRWREQHRAALESLYGTQISSLHRAGKRALDAVTIIEDEAGGDYVPANGALYPNSSFGNNMKLIAQIIKLQIGLRVTTVDLGGWDTHENQGTDGSGYFGDLIGNLSESLKAFYQDLDGSGADDYLSRTTVVVMSEFGRRLRENANRGTDHGTGGMMMVMGGNVIGGLHGPWPGLANEQLFDGADIDVATDYRQILSELMIRRLGNANLGTIFPGYSDYTPLNIVNGVDLPPNYEGAFKSYIPIFAAP